MFVVYADDTKVSQLMLMPGSVEMLSNYSRRLNALLQEVERRDGRDRARSYRRRLEVRDPEGLEEGEVPAGDRVVVHVRGVDRENGHGVGDVRLNEVDEDGQGIYNVVANISCMLTCSLTMSNMLKNVLLTTLDVNFWNHFNLRRLMTGTELSEYISSTTSTWVVIPLSKATLSRWDRHTSAYLTTNKLGHPSDRVRTLHHR